VPDRRQHVASASRTAVGPMSLVVEFNGTS
jgi:hypothetical protein